METPAPVLLDNIAYGIHTNGLAPMVYDTVFVENSPEQVSDTTLVTSFIHSNIELNSPSQYYNNPVISIEESGHTVKSNANMIPVTPVDRIYENIPDIASESNRIHDYTNRTVTLL